MTRIIYKLFPIYQYIYYVLFMIKQRVYMRILKIKLRKLGNHCQIYGAHIVEPYNVSVGHHVYINKGCDIITTGSSVEIGNFVMIGPHVTFIAQDHKIDDWEKPMILGSGYIMGKITVKDDVWIGTNSTILAGVTINRGAVVAAGAVVTKDVPEYSVVGGVPAKIIKYRFTDDLIEKAKNVDLNKFIEKKINWRKWGVGKIV